MEQNKFYTVDEHIYVEAFKDELTNYKRAKGLFKFLLTNRCCLT